VRSRVLTVGALAVAVATAAAGSTAGSLFYWFHCVDGDGGQPYVARDSLQKDVCGATGNGWVLLVVMIAAIAAAAYFANGALERWRRRAGSGLLAIAATVAVLAAPLAVFWLTNLPSDGCTDEQEAEVDRWRAEGGRGVPPHDCDSY
jgi:hypothetical protein